MSHGHFGLAGACPAGVALVNATPIRVSASASISTMLILVFMFILLALTVIPLFAVHGSCRDNETHRSATQSLHTIGVILAVAKNHRGRIMNSDLAFECEDKRVMNESGCQQDEDGRQQGCFHNRE